MSRIAIMQGRLGPPEAGRFQSFPRERWREEFAAARDAGLDAIEWIYDEYSEDMNPLATGDGIAEIKNLAAETGVEAVSICADYFMDRPLVQIGPERLAWLLGRAKLAGIERMVLPFVDNSRILSESDAARIVEMLSGMETHGIELHLETSLAPAEFAALLDRMPSPWIKANYDSGNSSSLGYDPAEEFAAYGDRIGSIHIKDRVRGGGTVPLGTGSADLKTVFREVERVGYRGDFVLQVARDQPGQEVEWARKNREIVMALMGNRA